MNHNLLLFENYVIGNDGIKKLKYQMLTEAEKARFGKDIIERLFKTIKEKALKINYENIEKSKGNFENYKRYKDIENCIGILDRMYKSQPASAPIEIPMLVDAFKLVKKLKNEFKTCFITKNQLGIIFYVNICATIISATANIILTTIEYIKTPNGSFEKIFKATSKRKLKENTYFKSLSKFITMERTGELKILFHPDKTLNESVIFGVLSVSVVALFTIVMFIRDLVFLFYRVRINLRDELLAMAYFLEENSNKLDITNDENKKVYERQQKLIEKLKYLAEIILSRTEAGEEEAEKDKEKDDKETTSNNGGEILI